MEDLIVFNSACIRRTLFASHLPLHFSSFGIPMAFEACLKNKNYLQINLSSESLY
jgi:hypothetical protein